MHLPCQWSRNKDQSNLTEMMCKLKEDPGGHEGFNVEIGDKNLKKNMAKGKQLHMYMQPDFQVYIWSHIEKKIALQEVSENLSVSQGNFNGY